MHQGRVDPDELHPSYIEEGPETTRPKPRPKRRTYPVSFMTVFEPTLRQLAQLERPAAYHRVLWACVGGELLDPMHWRTLTARNVAKAAGVSQISAERALAMLEADRVILAQGRASAKQRRLSRRLCSNVSAEDWAMAETDPPVVDGRGRGRPPLGVAAAPGEG